MKDDMKNDYEIRDIASYTCRTFLLYGKDRLRVAKELIERSGIDVRPEVLSYLQEAINADRTEL